MGLSCSKCYVLVCFYFCKLLVWTIFEVLSNAVQSAEKLQLPIKDHDLLLEALNRLGMIFLSLTFSLACAFAMTHICHSQLCLRIWLASQETYMGRIREASSC